MQHVFDIEGSGPEDKGVEVYTVRNDEMNQLVMLSIKNLLI